MNRTGIHRGVPIILSAFFTVPMAFLAVGLLVSFALLPSSCDFVNTVRKLQPLLLISCGIAVLLWMLAAKIEGGYSTRSRIGVAVPCVAAAMLLAFPVTGLAVASGTGALQDLPSVGRMHDALPDYSYDGALMFDGESYGVSIWEPDTDGTAPVVIMIHGGGWIQGSRNHGYIQRNCAWLASHGYMVAAPDYPVSSRGKHLWNSIVPFMAESIETITEMAYSHGGNPDAGLFIAGESAGAQIALDLVLEATAGAYPEMPDVDGISLLYPVVSARSCWYQRNPSRNAAMMEMLGCHIGGSPEEYPDRYESMEERLKVSASAPPALIAYGGADHLATPEATRRFIVEAREAGMDVRELFFPLSGHSMDDGESIEAFAWRRATAAMFDDIEGRR